MPEALRGGVLARKTGASAACKHVVRAKQGGRGAATQFSGAEAVWKQRSLLEHRGGRTWRQHTPQHPQQRLREKRSGTRQAAQQGPSLGTL